MSPLVFVANITPSAADDVAKHMTEWMRSKYPDVEVTHHTKQYRATHGRRLIEIIVNPGKDTLPGERDSIRNEIVSACRRASNVW